MLRASEVEPDGWRFDHDPLGSFPGMDFRPEPAPMAAFEEKHRELSGAEESGFVRTFVAIRRDTLGVDRLTGLMLTRIGGPDVGAERDHLWRRVLAAHEEWRRRQHA